VNVAELSSVLPPDTKPISPEERAAVIQARRRAVHTRFHR
jgi:pyruvoyl-dependent arginine decarboxylase (PvlArgDC)